MGSARRAKRGVRSRCLIGGVHTVAATRILGGAMRYCAEHHPNVELVFEDYPSPRQPDALRDGLIDIGICNAYLSLPDDPDLAHDRLLDDSIELALVAAAHPLAERDRLQAHELADPSAEPPTVGHRVGVGDERDRMTPVIAGRLAAAPGIGRGELAEFGLVPGRHHERQIAKRRRRVPAARAARRAAPGSQRPRARPRPRRRRARASGARGTRSPCARTAAPPRAPRPMPPDPRGSAVVRCSGTWPRWYDYRERLKSARISRAAFAPGPPVTPPPGWAPDPAR